ncbi:MAG: lysylphosphatidylglycerol synthase transmembrane domain-containing protein [Candidatus Omnitrophica bacterium]|nr:lysylphosphatidylglycerol synthase transmembrane domain-containing protein [Candidatus Omnitrophota bacterium]
MDILKKIFINILRFGVTIFLLIFLFKQVDEKVLIEVIRGSNKPLLIVAFISMFFTYALCIFRWDMLLRAAKMHLPLKRVVISAAGGAFFSLFLPSTIGGDLMRSIDLAVHTKRSHEVVATVLLDRLSGYIGLVIVTLFAVLFGWNLVRDNFVILLCVFVITFVLAAILMLLFNKHLYSKINKLLHSPQAGKIREFIKDLHKEMHIFRHHTSTVINNLVVSVSVQLIAPLTAYLIALSMGIKVNPAYFFIFVPIIGAITLLPISLGGLGLRDAITVFFFAKAGVGKDMAFAMSLVSFSFILVLGLAGGILYALTVRHRRIQYHKPHHIPLHP